MDEDMDWMRQAEVLSGGAPAYEASLMPQLEDGRWPVRSRVIHDKFGTGLIRGYEGNGDRTKIIVYFDRVGIKKLVMSYPGLRLTTLFRP